MSKQSVFVTGHKNPDTDSICAALSYAYLLNHTGKYQATAIRLGNISPETKFILDYFKVKAPKLMTNVKPRVKDIEVERVPLFAPNDSLKKAWKILDEHNLKTAIVTDSMQHLIGVVSSSTIVDGYMNTWDNNVLAESQTTIENIIHVLNGKAIEVEDERRIVRGDLKIIAMEGETMLQHINPTDVVIIGGGRHDVYADLIERRVGVMIFTGDFEPNIQIVELARKHQVALISSPYDTYHVARYIIQAIPLKYMMKRDQLVYVTNEDLIEDVKKTMASNRFRSYPVLERNTNRVLGMISRYHVVNDVKKRIIQVDHNERSQSIDGIEEAEVLEIIDHHRVADIQTNNPVFFRNEPVGSTSTIVAKMYFEQFVEPPKAIAGLLCAAIVSDTLLFKSPTCTGIDQEIASYLAGIAGIDLEEFAHRMFMAGTSLKGRKVEDIFNTDFKTFMIENHKVGIAQLNTMDIEGFLPIKKEMESYMEQMVKLNRYDLLILLLTDVIQGGSFIVYRGSLSDVVQKGFKTKAVQHLLYLPGIVSRKKQMLPGVIDVITRG